MFQMSLVRDGAEDARFECNAGMKHDLPFYDNLNNGQEKSDTFTYEIDNGMHPAWTW